MSELSWYELREAGVLVGAIQAVDAAQALLALQQDKAMPALTITDGKGGSRYRLARTATVQETTEAEWRGGTELEAWDVVEASSA
jgi:hypothetical protein